MKITERTLRISTASGLALIMVSVAYLLSGPNFLTNRTANAESTDKLLQAYAQKDTDADGLPDWQEALYGTDPNKVISNSFGIPDGEAAREGKLTPNALASQLPSADQGTTTLTDADFGGTPSPVPGSITDQFSQQFLQQLTEASNGQPLDDATQQQLIANLMSSVNKQVASTLASHYGAVDVHTSASVSLSAYALSVEQIFEGDSSDLGNPYDLMLTAIESTDPHQQATAEKNLAKASQVLASMASQLRAIQVPVAQANTHVLLVQSLDELSRSSAIVSAYQKDPVAALGALGVYTSGTDMYSSALNQLATSILSQGEPAQDEPGYYLVSLARLSNS